MKVNNHVLGICILQPAGESLSVMFRSNPYPSLSPNLPDTTGSKSSYKKEGHHLAHPPYNFWACRRALSIVKLKWFSSFFITL